MADTKNGPSEDTKYDIGYGKASVEARRLVNTSRVQLPNEQMVLIDGSRVSTGYMSNSSLDSYTRCAMQFYLKYIKKEKTRLLPKLKMQGGIAVHDALDMLVQSKLNGPHISKEFFLTHINDHLDAYEEKYAEQFTKSRKKKEDPEVLDFGKIGNMDAFKRLYISVASSFYDGDYQSVKPIATEKLFIYHMEVDSGGTIPIVGFIDLIESIAGTEVITDYKVGAKKKQSDADYSQQLTLYSMAEKIPHVAISALQLGTTGGKKPENAKPGEVVKYISTRTVKDYERTTENVNAALKGIEAGAYPRSGMHNPMVCARSQCPYFDKCLG